MAQPPEEQNDLTARIQRLEDIEAIKWMIVRYAQGADQHNVDIMLPLFADDAVWDAGERFGRYEGKPAIYEFLKGSGSFIGWTLHYMVSPQSKLRTTEIRPRRSGICGRQRICRISKRVRPEATWIGGTYDTELARVDGEWKFKKVNLRIKLLAPYAEGWAKKQVRD
jgi:hypothetical protein